MAATAALTTQIPMDLKQALEDLVDSHALEEAQRTAGSFRSWDDVERELKESNKI
jgi:hypothetical protein